MNSLLTTFQAAEQLSLSPQRVRQFCRQGRLGFRVGGRWVISQQELDEFKNKPRKVGRPKAK